MLVLHGAGGSGITGPHSAGIRYSHMLCYIVAKYQDEHFVQNQELVRKRLTNSISKNHKTRKELRTT